MVEKQFQFDPWLHRFAVLTALATLGLVGMGGLVTSHGVGMAVPDWPTSYGYNMFALPISTWFTGGIFHEHTHRLWASEVGILTVMLVCWLYGRKAKWVVRILGVILVLAGLAALRRPNGLQAGLHIGIHGLILFPASFFWPNCEPASRALRRLGWLALLAVLLQGLLGGLRVVLDSHVVGDVRMGTAFGIVHGCLGQAFLVITAAVAMMTGRWWVTRSGWDGTATQASAGLRKWFQIATALIFVQLLIAATMRHQHAGLAIPDFPFAYGKLWPDAGTEAVARYNQQRIEVTAHNPITAFQIYLQMTHRIAAALILIGVTVCAWRARVVEDVTLRRTAFVWLGLICVQIALGAWTIWSNKAADVATAHVVVGALSLVTGALGCIICFRRFTGIAVPEAAVFSETTAIRSAPAR